MKWMWKSDHHTGNTKWKKHIPYGYQIVWANERKKVVEVDKVSLLFHRTNFMYNNANWMRVCDR